MKAQQVRIRKVGRGDIDRIIDIERSWQHLSHWSIDSYYRLLNDDDFTSSFVAESDEVAGPSKIVGFVIFHVVAEVSEIYNIAVGQEYARQGIGRQLLAAAIEESGRLGAVKVLLEVRKSNRSAIHFYHEFRFSIVGDRRHYYSNPLEDAFVMERPVDPNSH